MLWTSSISGSAEKSGGCNHLYTVNHAGCCLVSIVAKDPIYEIYVDEKMAEFKAMRAS